MRQQTSAIAAVLAGAFVLAVPVAPMSAPFQDETLLVAIPQGFVVGKQAQAGAMVIAEYIPQGETVTDWSRMITVQVFHNIQKGDPERFADGMRTQWLAACSGSDARKARDGQENGYPFSLWVFSCPMNAQTGKPETMFAKFIGGNDSFYSIQYAYRSALTKEIITPTVQYLAGVKVCDTRLLDRACPRVMTP